MKNGILFGFALITVAIFGYWIVPTNVPAGLRVVFALAVAGIAFGAGRVLWGRNPLITARLAGAMIFLFVFFFTRPFLVDVLDSCLHKNAFFHVQLDMDAHREHGASPETVNRCLEAHDFRDVDGKVVHIVMVNKTTDSTYYTFDVPEAGADVCGPYDLVVKLSFDQKGLNQAILFRSSLRTSGWIDGDDGCRKWRVLDYPF